MHLNEVELVDLAEGSRPESSAPHLASCERCRQQVLEMRRVVAAAADVPVPEPSPLFWDHLSDRVRQAVAAERDAPRRWWHDVASRKRVLIPASAVAVAAVVIVTALTPRLLAPQPQGAGSASSQPAAAIGPGADAPDDGFDDAGADDESLMLVADLSAAINVDPATAADLGSPGGAEHAVTHLNADELRELQRLLQQELVPSGA
jgi:hypothetical protein